MKPRPAARILLPAALFLAAAALVVAVSWPWVLHWRGAFLDHWDPPFHAWKLEFIARRVLAGDVFLSSGDTNALYPHSGTLYYEALQYPPALFAAALFGATSMPPELVYHVTLLVFWALSAPCMFFLLRTLDCSRPAASFGALAFCILPWRMGYAPEFQMELVFAVPLVFAFLVRFLRDRRAADAVSCALSWWLLAVSELYEAAFVALAVPFVEAAFSGREPRMLREKRFWRGALAGAAAGLVSLFVLLRPYLTQRGEGAVLRSLEETALHAAQPFSYLRPSGEFALWSVNARLDEMRPYPTLALLLLCLAGAAWRVRSLARTGASAADVRAKRFRRRLPLLAFLGAAGAAALFLAVCAAFHLGALSPASRPATGFWRFSAGLLALAALAEALVPVRGESPQEAFLRGMAGAAGVFYLFSFGPRLSLGDDLHFVAKTANPVYLVCHDRLLPFLSSFRVVSRFGVLVVFAALCAAAVSLDRLFAARPRLRPGAKAALCALLLAAVAFEAVPARKRIARYAPVDDQRASPAIARLVAEHPVRTIAAFPMGPRRIESERMFSLIKGDWPSVYAWGGFFPAWAVRVQDLAARFDVRSFRHELAKLFPDALLVADASVPVRVDRIDGDPPAGAIVREAGRSRRFAAVDWEKAWSGIAVLRDRDDRFLLFDLEPEPPAPEVEKMFRSDVARMNPVVRAAVETKTAGRVTVRLNGGTEIAAAAPAGGGPFEWSFDLLRAGLGPLEKAAPNSLVFRTDDGSPLSVRSFRLEGRDGVYHDTCAPYSPVRAAPPRDP